MDTHVRKQQMNVLKVFVFIIMLLALAGCGGNAAVNVPDEQTPAPSRTENPRTRFAVIVPSTTEPTSEPTSDDTEDTEDPVATEPDDAAVTERPGATDPTVAPATAKPASTVAPATAKPAGTVAPATAKPASTVAPSTAKPASTVAPATAKPASTVAPATAKPVVDPNYPDLPDPAFIPIPTSTGTFPEKITLEFSRGDNYTGRKLKEASGFDGSGFNSLQIGEMVQYWQETDAGIESAIEVNGRLLSLGIVSPSRKNLPEFMSCNYEYRPHLYRITRTDGTMPIYFVDGTDAYEVLSLEAQYNPRIAELGDGIFLILGGSHLIKVDVDRGEVCYAKLDLIPGYKYSATLIGGHSFDICDKDGNIKASYALLENELILSGRPDKTGFWPELEPIDSQVPTNWRQIVRNSQFQLGETYEKGYREDGAPIYGFRFGSYPSLDSLSAAIPMAIEFARQHLGLSKNDLQSFTSAGNAYDEHRNLIRKTLDQYPSYLSDRFAEGYVSSEDEHAVDLVLSTYPSEADLNLAKSSGENLKIEKVGVDAFIFIVNKDNPVESLTLDQVRDIYSGKVTNWSEVGGNDIPIIPYQRDEGTETQTGMEQLVMKGTPMLPPELTSMFRSMGKVLYPVAEYGNWAGSIGYTYLRYFGKLYEGKDIKILKIGGVGATQEALASERYPLAISYYGAVRESDGPDSAGHKFLEWILSSEGQESVKQAGYSPVR